MLSNTELERISGGAIKWSVALIIGSVLTLIAGIFDGYKRPLPCHR